MNFPMLARVLVLVCGSAVAMPIAAAADAKPIDVVRHKFDAVNRHDVEAIQQTYATDATLHSPDYPSLSGNAPIADTYRKIFAAIPDAKDEIETLEASPNHVYVQFALVGHFGGAQDKPVRVRLIAVYAVSRGHIVDDVTYYDRKAL